MSIMTLAAAMATASPDTIEAFRQTYPDRLATLKAEANAFRESHEALPQEPADNEALNRWAASSAGQDCLAALTDDILAFIDAYPSDGAPGHDKRHIFKDLASSLRIVREEGWQNDWRSMLVFPSLLHDSGRLIEEAVVGEKLAGVDNNDHACISYEFARDMFDRHDLPPFVRDEMLYAILVHASGKSPRMMAQAVMRADREQLVGV